MDPTESILSTLNYTFDSLTSNDDWNNFGFNSSSSIINDDLLLNDIDDVNDFITTDNLLDTINDQLLFQSLNNFNDDHYDDFSSSSSSSSLQFLNNGHHQHYNRNHKNYNTGYDLNSSIFKQQQRQQKNLKSTTTTTKSIVNRNLSNPTVSILKQSQSSSTRYRGSKLSNNVNFVATSVVAAAASAVSATTTTTTMTISPKVYVTQKKSAKNFTKGTSILAKQQSRKSNKSLLFSSMSKNKNPNLSMIKASSASVTPKSILMSNVVELSPPLPISSSSSSTLDNESKISYHPHISLRDHDYCSNIIFLPTTTTTTNDDNNNNDCKKNENEIDDILNGYCPDDVMLKELPECLSDLIGGLDSNDLMNNNNTDDLLNHLNNACNIMTEQYLEEALSNQDDLNLPDLNLTEEDLKQVIDSCLTEDIFNDDDDDDNNDEDNHSPDLDNITKEHQYSSNNIVDNSDAASVTTGSTEDDISMDDKKSPFIRLKNQIKSKRNRSLSSSSSTMILTKRKRRFSTRSSVNSSDAMSSSESSSLESIESSSSRSSSPERTYNLAKNFMPNIHNHYYYAKNNHQNNNNNNKYQQTINKKHRIEMNMDKGKQWTKAYSKTITKKQQLSTSLPSSSLLSNKNNKCRNTTTTTTTLSKNNNRKHQQQQQKNFIDINRSIKDIDSQPEKLDFRINNNDDKLKTNDRINGYGGGDDNDRNDDEDFDILLRSAAEAFKYFQQHQQQQQQQKQKQQKT